MKLLSFLDIFNAVSGNKLIIAKTQILSFNYKPSHHKNSFQVVIPKELTKLCNLNFNPLNKKIKEDIKRWNLLPILRFESQIESVKINVLPRMLYLFQTLPIEITDKQFNE